MKLPTSTKPTSGFHICDILELNKEKQQKKQEETRREEEETLRVDENDDEDELEMKTENLSRESDEIVSKNENCAKRKHSPSPTSPMRESQSPLESPQAVKDLKKLKKHLKHDNEKSSFDATSGHHQLLNETLHQYPHLFQNHPAMRPWFNSNGELRNFIPFQSPLAVSNKFRFRIHEPFYRISRFNWAHRDGDDDVCCTIYHLYLSKAHSLVGLWQMFFRALSTTSFFIDSTIVVGAWCWFKYFSIVGTIEWKHEIDSELLKEQISVSIESIVALCGSVSMYLVVLS